MKQRLMMTLALWLCSMGLIKADNVISICTDNLSLIYKVDDNNKVYQSYFGTRLDKASAEQIQQGTAEIYPTFGTSYVNEAALRAVHTDGNTSTELYFDGVQQTIVNADVTRTVISLKDGYYPFRVKLCFEAYQHSNVIAQWSEISHAERGG